LINTSYTVTGGTFQGCNTSSSIISVSVNPSPTLTVSSSNSVLCVGQTATLNASGANTYSWTNSAITATTSVNPIVTTNYSVTGTNTLGCSKTVVITQSVIICTNLNESINNNPIAIFPNPAKAKLIVSLDFFSDLTTVEIYTISGSLLIKQKINDLATQINISECENGIYFLLLKENGRVIEQKKIIKE
ncbi:MAG: T9SS type A sorting domain-containing protein, partial [Bacteroidia bacterium]